MKIIFETVIFICIFITLIVYLVGIIYALFYHAEKKQENNK